MRSSLYRLLWAALAIAVLACLVPVALTDAAMRTAERNQSLAEAFIADQWPGFEVQGGSNIAMGHRVSRRRVIGVDNGKVLTITVLVDRGIAELLGVIEGP